MHITCDLTILILDPYLWQTLTHVHRVIEKNMFKTCSKALYVIPSLEKKSIRMNKCMWNRLRRGDRVSVKMSEPQLYSLKRNDLIK